MSQYLRYILLFLFCFSLYLSNLAQLKDIGKPFIKNFDRSVHNGGQQTWMIEHAFNGKMYFANNEGLIEFDGHNWSLKPIPNGTVVRCLLNTEDGRLYVGGFNEFGYFKEDSLGTLNYFSLLDLIPEENRSFDEVWKIHETPDGIVFQSFVQLMIFNDDVVRVIPAPGLFHFSFCIDGQLIVNDVEKGLQRFAMNRFFPLHGTDRLKGLEVWTILPYTEDKLLIGTSTEGLFLYDGNTLTEWHPPVSPILKENQLYSALKIEDRYLCFGTIQDGLVICTTEGDLVQKINRGSGLANNTVLCMDTDHFGNLWLGTDIGIDYIEVHSPLSLLSYNEGLSAGYTAVSHNNYLYMGTNQGVFYMKWDDFISGKTLKDDFSLIESTRGQVWTLQIIDNQLFCGHNNGSFLIDEGRARRISRVPGGWTFIQAKNDPTAIIGGTYEGLVLYRKINGEWAFQKKIEGFEESSRFMVMEPDEGIWMSHGLKGVYHIYLNHGLDSINHVNFYNSNNGFTSDFGINVSRLNNRTVFSSPDGVYRYNRTTNVFEPDDELNSMFNLRNIDRIIEDRQGDIWCFANEHVSVLRKQEDGSYINIDRPFRQLRGRFIGGFEFVYSVDNSNVFFGVADGFVHYDPTKEKNYREGFTTYINEVKLLRIDSILSFTGNSARNFIPELAYINNSLSFNYSANDFENKELTLFSTYLDGYDQDWTDWDSRKTREFTNLRDGNYTFYVKAKNIYEVESDQVSFSFNVKPPWVKSLQALTLFSFILLLCILGIIYWLKRRIERSKKIEELKQERKFKEKEEVLKREAIEAEKEIIRLRNETLREKMITKDKELANSTMQMIQKNKFLNTIKEELKKISAQSLESNNKSSIAQLVRRIDRDIDSENQWKVFETHFENVHEAFLKSLKTKYPDLTPSELKLCAYLRMNISSKEIAILLNISTRGVEISRYRLRKKLKLERTTNLTDFILSFKTE